jgi:hypothetical protein
MNFHDLQQFDILDHLNHFLVSNSKPVLFLVFGSILEMDFFNQNTLDMISWSLRNICYCIAIGGFINSYMKPKEKKNDKEEKKNDKDAS